MRLKDPSDYPAGASRFVAYWLHDVVVGFQKRGFTSLIPWRPLVSGAVGFAAARYIAVENLAKPEVMIAAYAAMLTINAILLAVCWSAFAKIFETMGEERFGSWLRRNGLAGYYGWYVDFIHAVQMLAVVAAATSLIVSLMGGLPEIVPRLALGLAVGLSVLASWWAMGCVRLMRDLSDHRATFAAMDADGRVKDMPVRGKAG